MDSVKKGNEKSCAEQSKTQNNKNSKPINLIFYINYCVLRKHLDSLTDFIKKHDKSEGSLDYSLRVLLPEALIKPVQVT